MISELYKRKEYEKVLFEQEIKEINQSSFTVESIEALVNKCEDKERIRTIIENYLTYIVELNFEPISKLK